MKESNKPKSKDAMQELRGWLSHPLLLLLVGALISNYLIPGLTRQWQINEKALEIKTSLVNRISTSVAGVVTTAQLGEIRATSQTQQEYDDAFRIWETERGVIGSQIEAYFPGTQIGSEWDTYSGLLTEVYALAGTDAPILRQARLKEVQTYLPESKLDWAILARAEYRESAHSKYREYVQAWISLKRILLAKRDDFTRKILNSSIEPLK